MPTPVFETPQDAEDAFYRAAESGDVAAMMAVWAEDQPIECIHPMGPRLAGRRAIEGSWRRIFGQGPGMRFRIEGVSRTVGSVLALHLVYENILIDRGEDAGEALVVATNVYRLTAAGWRMILHHASPSPSRAPREEADASQTVH